MGPTQGGGDTLAGSCSRVFKRKGLQLGHRSLTVWSWWLVAASR